MCMHVAAIDDSEPGDVEEENHLRLQNKETSGTPLVHTFCVYNML